MLRLLLAAGVGFYLGTWLSNYRWVMALNEVGAEIQEQRIEQEAEDGFADLDDWRSGF